MSAVAVTPQYRCPVCGDAMVHKPSLGLVCVRHQPIARCQACKVFVGEAYVEQHLYDGLCWSCRQFARRHRTGA